MEWGGNVNIGGAIALTKYLRCIHSVDTETSTDLLEKEMISVKAASTTRENLDFQKYS